MNDDLADVIRTELGRHAALSHEGWVLECSCGAHLGDAPVTGDMLDDFTAESDARDEHLSAVIAATVRAHIADEIAVKADEYEQIMNSHDNPHALGAEFSHTLANIYRDAESIARGDTK